MGSYENGTNTRQAIVQACTQLFYEKGFHETGYSDICTLAHLNRGTVYYHFKSKEEIRYEVMWEYIIHNKRIVEQYCPNKQYLYIIAMSMYWLQIANDEKIRRFMLQCCTDFPVYTGKKDLTYFYHTIYDAMWGDFWEKKKIPQLSYASVYGYIMSYIRMICEHPQNYDPLELYEHCAKTSFAIWSVPMERVDRIWEDIARYIAQIPVKYLQTMAWIFEESSP